MLCQIADDITPKCDNHTIVICMELHIRSQWFFHVILIIMLSLEAR
jgi:hypothetical protein